MMTMYNEVVGSVGNTSFFYDFFALLTPLNRCVVPLILSLQDTFVCAMILIY